MKKITAFTLIEVLVVMLILGIITSVAVISYSPPPFKQQRDQLNLLLDKINALQEKALLESTPYGVLLFEEKYLILTINADNTWVEAAGFSAAELDLSDASLEINQSLVDIPKSEFTQTIFPQIVMTPGAEMTAFYLSVRYYDRDTRQSVVYELETDILGRGKLTEVAS